MSWAKQIDGLLLRQAAKKADQLRRALLESVDIEGIVRAWQEAHPAGGSVTRDEARAWAKVHVILDPRPVQAALAQIYAVGYAIGSDVALSAYAHRQLEKPIAKAPAAAPPPPPSGPELSIAVKINWDTWQPGNHPAQLLTRPKGGLETLLNKRGVTIKDLDSASLDRVGTRLADALETGISGTELARNLSDVFDSPLRALTVANTEMARAMSVATTDNYKNLGVEQIEWRSLDGCDYCAENEDAGPIALGDEFPSGDTEPPAHPNCRCSLLPVIDMGEDLQLDESDADLELAIKPELSGLARSIGVPGPLEVARALSRLEILPNPNEMDLKHPEKFVESFWEERAMPTVDPNLWDTATIQMVELAELVGTDPYLRRKKIREKIETLGQASSPYRSFAMVVRDGDESVIVDGHHRLAALWLLGLDRVPVWFVGE